MCVSVCVCVYTHKSFQLCPTLHDPMGHSPPGSSVDGVSPGKNTGVGCHDLFQRSFPTQGMEPLCPLMSSALLADSLPLGYWGSLI